MKVKCINNEDVEEFLTVGKVYNVIDDNNTGQYFIENDLGEINYFYIGRFEVVKNTTNEPITSSKIDSHKKICEELTRIYEKKNNDYGDSFGKGFKEYGMTMPCIRLEDKLLRLKSLTVQNKEQKVSDESIEDTLLDLANYAIMSLIEMRGNKNEE